MQLRILDWPIIKFLYYPTQLPQSYKSFAFLKKFIKQIKIEHVQFTVCLLKFHMLRRQLSPEFLGQKKKETQTKTGSKRLET